MKGLSRNFKATSLDSLATSSNQSESLSDESHDSDSGAEMKSKFIINNNNKCDVYNNEVPGDRKMEPIPEEEPKVSVKEILARFENLKENKKTSVINKDLNNNNNNEDCGGNKKQEFNNTVLDHNGEDCAPVSCFCLFNTLINHS